jgi:DNA polymerase I-like protein with 3'-5' exonuclease and polymerase domains
VAFDTEFDPLNRLTRYSMADVQLNGWVIEAEDHTPTAVLNGTRIIAQNAPADIGHFTRLFALTHEDVQKYMVMDDIMLKHAVLYAGYAHDLDFQGSWYSGLNRWKHLAFSAPRDYSGGDAIGTMEVDLALNREFQADPLSYKVYSEFLRPHVWTIERAVRVGMGTYAKNVDRFLDELTTQAKEATLMAEAAVGFPINLGSPGRSGQVGVELYDVMKLPTKRGTK